MKLKITLEKLNKLQNKISLLNNHEIKVDTENGFKKIKNIGITSPNSDKIKIKTIMRPRNSYQLEDLLNLIKTDIG